MEFSHLEQIFGALQGAEVRYLLAMKRVAARPQDLADIAELLSNNPDAT